ncbi:MAG: 5'-nucleotidase C-terminal domain-containing protein, partial [candidate division WOR-3 bacterium]|nr:5'-nucleotidase C-terminal domain-containing protein [candidate division WOR-3 bacterium]
QSGGSLHLAGVEYELEDGTAANIRVGGASLDESRTYKIATNNSLAAGGDGYAMLKDGKDVYDTGTLVSDVLVRYVKKMGVIK